MASTRRVTPLRIIDPEPAHCSTERRYELLGQAQFFAHLPAEKLGAVNERFREVHYEQGAWIWHPGDDATEMFIVAAGQVKLVQHGAEGKDVVLRFAGPGDLIGESAAIGHTTYVTGAQAQTDCCLLRVESNDFQHLLKAEPSIALEVLQFAGEQLEDARQTIRSLSTKSVEQRIASVLLQLAEKHGEQSEHGLLIQLPLPQQDLAAMTGTTVETVSRILTQFKEQNLVQTGRRWVAIVDENGLTDVIHA